MRHLRRSSRKNSDTSSEVAIFGHSNSDESIIPQKSGAANSHPSLIPAGTHRARYRFDFVPFVGHTCKIPEASTASSVAIALDSPTEIGFPLPHFKLNSRFRRCLERYNAGNVASLRDNPVSLRHFVKVCLEKRIELYEFPGDVGSRLVLVITLLKRHPDCWVCNRSVSMQEKMNFQEATRDRLKGLEIIQEE